MVIQRAWIQNPAPIQAKSPIPNKTDRAALGVIRRALGLRL
jgi:hypothetical protein